MNKRVNKIVKNVDGPTQMSSCSSFDLLASALRKEPIFLAIILFRLCDGENSRERRARERGRIEATCVGQGNYGYVEEDLKLIHRTFSRFPNSANEIYGGLGGF